VNELAEVSTHSPIATPISIAANTRARVGAPRGRLKIEIDNNNAKIKEYNEDQAA